MASHIIPLYSPPLWHCKFYLPFFVHNIYFRNLCPSMEFHCLPVLFRGIPLSLISCIALYDSPFHIINYRLHKIRTKKILVSHLTGMKLYSHPARELYTHDLIHSYHCLRCNILCKIDLSFPHTSITSCFQFPLPGTCSDLAHCALWDCFRFPPDSSQRCSLIFLIKQSYHKSSQNKS